jgi:phage terminase Nu1 subunit (DNA packaging protein)
MPSATRRGRQDDVSPELSAALKGVAAVLKKRFPNLTVEDIVDISADLMVAIDKAYQKVKP